MNDKKEIERVEEQLNTIHSLAVTFYRMMGYEHKEEHGKLYNSQHPTEQIVWDMAVYAYRDIDGLDGEELLDELEEWKSWSSE